MSYTLYLIETKAQRDYVCKSCNRVIKRGARHFRHDPVPQAKYFRGELTTHWCRACILSSDPGPKDSITGRIRIPAIQVRPVLTRVPPSTLAESEQLELPITQPLRIELIGIGQILTRRLQAEPSLLQSLTPNQFEELVCDRLSAMGLELRRTGAVNQKDGGIDILFWPRNWSFPFLGAAQVKHHQEASAKEGPSSVREFAGVIGSHPINAGILVTNTSFTPDARWFAYQHAHLIRLRDFTDIRRWLFDNFTDDAEWREIPQSIELCPGVTVKIR